MVNAISNNTPNQVSSQPSYPCRSNDSNLTELEFDPGFRKSKRVKRENDFGECLFIVVVGGKSYTYANDTILERSNLKWF